MYKILVACLCAFLSVSSLAQSQEELIRKHEQEEEVAHNAMMTRIMDEGVKLMDAGEYKEADIRFRDVLKNARVVPTDLTYYFGKNSYYLGKYQQCIDWLTKYVQLKGTGSQHYQETQDLLNKAKQGFRLVREEEKKNTREVLSSNYQIDCGPSGKVICPVCQGKTVIITKGPLGTSYKECPYSDKYGYLSCEDYNLLLRGELKPKDSVND